MAVIITQAFGINIKYIRHTCLVFELLKLLRPIQHWSESTLSTTLQALWQRSTWLPMERAVATVPGSLRLLLWLLTQETELQSATDELTLA